MKESKTARQVEGLWSRYLNVSLKYALRPVPPHVIEQHKDSFYLGAAALCSLVKAVLIHPQTKDDPEAIRCWVEEIHKELHEYIARDDDDFTKKRPQ